MESNFCTIEIVKLWPKTFMMHSKKDENNKHIINKFGRENGKFLNVFVNRFINKYEFFT
jgi:hypothetical protein